MKKNLISVLILGICVVNLILNIMILMSMPGAKKTNSMIEKICAAIDLDLASGMATSASNVPADEQEIYKISEGADITTRLKGDGEHYIVYSVTLSLNKNSEYYEKNSPTVLAELDSVIASKIITIMSQHTYEDVTNNRNQIVEEILTELRTAYGMDYIIGVNFPKWTIS